MTFDIHRLRGDLLIHATGNPAANQLQIAWYNLITQHLSTWQNGKMDSYSNQRVSIVIKALNEEQRIADSIESALAAVENTAGEVILADSGSSDGTIEIASRYPITIVQLGDWSERRCGIGPQLGYQFCEGDFVYILDGDMKLDPDFLGAALERFQHDERLGGVAGLVDEHSEGSLQFRGRKARNLEGTAGPAGWLDMGGLYRRSAIDRIGYLSNRNLYACEEQELGLRLANAGWQLERLGVKSIDHYGHTEPTISLLKKRWKSGYLYGAGQVIRASLGKPWFFEVVRVHKHLVILAALWLCLLIGLLPGPFSQPLIAAWALGLTLITIQRCVRNKSIKDGALSMIVWHVNSLAMVIGLFLTQVDPTKTIDAKTLHNA